ncbi:MAG TPA: NUDIX hydrolase [Bacillus bacterium]|uniref:DNA mismatch repair protein MutT n=1 Tax=Siminovitchia fordii TaxID=254759 RepID=A0ABQ4K6Q6_9BACI|nr:DNA mismatch repair protein MutT [Siminovitchia fordii]HBZ11339.1 NUDIX hydrolase [Bacillus sp. (in: firmicutes)]
MSQWIGAAGVCVNEHDELLMVLLGKPEEIKTWSVPSGGLESGETIEECCIREVYEETGYQTEIIEKLYVKNTVIDNFDVQVHYFLLRIIGGEATIQDPDQLIHQIAWIPKELI